MKKADLSKKPEVLKTVDTFLSAIPWTKNRTVIVYLREHGGRRYVRMRTFNKHCTKGCWYPVPPENVVPVYHPRAPSDYRNMALTRKDA